MKYDIPRVKVGLGLTKHPEAQSHGQHENLTILVLHRGACRHIARVCIGLWPLDGDHVA